MKTTEKATTERTYTEQEVKELIAKAIKQDRELQAQMLRSLPIISTEARQRWIEKPDAIAEGLWKMFCPVGQKVSESSPVPRYPADDEAFELELDGDAIDPLQMVRNDGYTGEWKFNGPKVQGKQKAIFKLIRVGYCANVAAVKAKKLPEGTSLAEGEWREPFKAKYPQQDGNGPVGFAGSEWLDPDGDVSFPFVGDCGRSGFDWVEGDFDGRWRWLVRVG